MSRRVIGPRSVLTLGAAICAVFVPATAHGITRCEVLAAAQRWVDDGVMYSWDAHYTDPTTGVCCYRSDCSGLVSARSS